MSDFLWFSYTLRARIEPLFSTDGRGNARVDDRLVLSGIIHALRCGGRWAECADVFGPDKTLLNRFVRWSERGIWKGVFSALAGAGEAADRLCIEAMPPSAKLVADKGYDSQALREWLIELGAEPAIPGRKNRKIQCDYDRVIYKQRNVVERMFFLIKDWRRIATRFNRNPNNFMDAIGLAAAVIWWL